MISGLMKKTFDLWRYFSLRIVLSCLCAAGVVIAPAHAQDAAADANSAATSQSIEPAAAAPDTEGLPPLIPTRHFAARAQIESPQLSPSGRRVSFLRDIGGQNEIALSDPANGQSLGSVLIPDGATIISYEWVSEDSILIRALVRFRHKKALYSGAPQLYIATVSTGQVLKLVADPFLAAYASAIWHDEAGRTALIAHPHKKDEDCLLYTSPSPRDS